MIDPIYSKENLWLYHGDNVEIMKQMPENWIDLTVTSPPYDNLREYTKESEWNFEKFCKIAKELYRITSEGGTIVWVVGDATVKGSETGSSFRQALYFMDLGFRLHDTMIYEKDAIAFPDRVRYQQSFEYMFIFTKGSPKTKNLIQDRNNVSFGRKISGTSRLKTGETVKMDGCGKDIKEFGIRWNVWRIATDKGNNKLGHPAMFPEILANDHILSWSNENDIVFDPFNGSGTTGKMAKLLNRKYVGIEIAKEYIDISIKRFDESIAPAVVPIGWPSEAK